MATFENHGQHDPALFAAMDLATLRAQDLVQQGAIHALSTLLGLGCTARTAREMLDSLRTNAQMIRAEAACRGVALFDDDQLANPHADQHVDQRGDQQGVQPDNRKPADA